MKRVNIIVPVYYGNLPQLEWSISKQVNFFKRELEEYDWKIIISLNGKKEEKIWEKILELSRKYPEVIYDYTEIQGKGNSVVQSLQKFRGDVNMYMDVDLATDLSCVKPLVREIENGYDISVGSRYVKGAKSKRRLVRYLVSKLYNYIGIRIILGMNIKDTQCGFKAMNSKVIETIIPKVKNKGWFFDGELLYHAKKSGYKIKEVPIIWTEDKMSGLKIGKASKELLINAIKLRMRRL